MENNIGEARRSYALTVPGGRYTQKDAARDFGVSLGKYRRWEQGACKGMQGEDLRRIARKYDTTVDYLLKITDDPKVSYRVVQLETPDADELGRIFGRLDDGKREQLLEFARYLEGKS